MSNSYFHRANLADMFSRRSLSEKGASGIFISSPRRTGKSTFIREDLLPKLESCGAEVIYVDLWADKSADPGEIIVAAIHKRIAATKSMVSGLIKKSGLDNASIDVAGILKVGVSKKVRDGEITITDSLALLSENKKTIIVLVIDEAQHATTTEQGANALFALKAARDELNSSGNYGFRLIATGSNRDKLATLVNNKEHAFYGAPLVELPYLGRDFLEWELSRFESDVKPSIDAMLASFDLCGYRPEYLSQSLDALLFQLDLTGENVDSRLAVEVSNRLVASRLDFLKQVNSLPPLQYSVLKVMAAEGDNFAPFKSATIEKYKQVCGDLAEEVKIDSSSAQAALESLRDKSLIWKVARSAYTLEDAQYAKWLME